MRILPNWVSYYDWSLTTPIAWSLSVWRHMGCERFLPAFFIEKIAPLKSTKQSHKELARLTSEKKSFTILIFCTRFCKWLIYNSVDSFRFTHSLINTEWTHEAEKHVMMIIMLNLNTQVWDNRWGEEVSSAWCTNTVATDAACWCLHLHFQWKQIEKASEAMIIKLILYPLWGSRVVIV